MAGCNSALLSHWHCWKLDFPDWRTCFWRAQVSTFLFFKFCCLEILGFVSHPDKKTLMLVKIEGKRRRGQATENEMVGWHHQLNEHEFEQTPGDREGRGSLACCSPSGCRVRLDWPTEQLKTWAVLSLQNNAEAWLINTLFKALKAS